MIDQFAFAVRQKIKDEMDTLCNELASGRSKNYEDYRYTCGVLRGLAAADEYIQDLAKLNEDAE